MGMKPRLDDANKKIEIPNTASCQNHTSGEETNPNIPNTVTTHKVVGNVPLVENIVSKVNSHG